MPCYDHLGEEQSRKDRDTITRLACEYLTLLEKSNQPIPDYAREWWESHKRADAKDD
jgi:hypothetical protein